MISTKDAEEILKELASTGEIVARITERKIPSISELYNIGEIDLGVQEYDESSTSKYNLKSTGRDGYYNSTSDNAAFSGFFDGNGCSIFNILVNTYNKVLLVDSLSILNLLNSTISWTFPRTVSVFL